MKNSLLSRKTSKITGNIYIVLLAIIMYLPVVLLIVFSFASKKVSFADETAFDFSFSLYEEMFKDQEMMMSVVNSFIIGTVASFFATIIGTSAAVGLFYMKKTPRSLIENSGQITMVNADIVTAMAFILFFNLVGFIPRGYATLLISHTTICIPYVVMSVLPRLSQLDPNVYEAGLDLGLTPLKTLFKVILPQLLGAMISGFLLAFTISFEDFTISNFLNNNGSVETVPTFLYTHMRNGAKPYFRALATFIMAIVTVVMLLMNILANRKKKAKHLG